jgi:RNA polymerase sigma-70 factor (ECF subfamily)
MADFKAAMQKLPDDQREALILVGASGFSYEDAAKICGVAIGTIKSRVNRARTHLARRLNIESTADIGPDTTSEATFSALRQSGTRGKPD